MFKKTKAEDAFETTGKRIAILTAAVSFISGAAADFFSPLGAQYITGSIAVLCVIFMIALYKNRPAISNWLKGTFFDDFFPCDTKCYKTPLFLYLLIIASICGTFGLITGANAKGGGVLASRFDQVRAYQSMMGVMVSIDQKVGRIDKTVTSIDEKMQNVKKEYSDNPRIQLGNEAGSWSRATFTEALRDGDFRRVSLFLEGGMRMDSDDMRLFIENFDADIGNMILDPKRADPLKACLMDPSVLVDALDYPDKTEFLHKLCSNRKLNENIRKELERLRPEAERQLQKKKKPEHFVRECIKEINISLPPNAMFKEASDYYERYGSIPGWSPWGSSGLPRKFDPKEVAVVELAYAGGQMTVEKYNQAVNKACTENGIDLDNELIDKYETLKLLAENIFY